MRLLDIPVCWVSANNCLVIPCQGKKDDGSSHCGGMIRIPFTPTIGGTQLAEPNEGDLAYWTRVSGETLNDITLSPSINAHECGHFHIINGEVTP